MLARDTNEQPKDNWAQQSLTRSLLADVPP
jgi:hypothetical protein